MDYYISSDEDCYYSDREQFDEFEDDRTELPWAPQKAPSCKVITRASLLSAQREDLSRVMELLSLKEYHARTLLIHHRWDVEKVFAVFVEKGRASLFAEAGVTLAGHCGSNPRLHSDTLTCNICTEDVSSDESTKMDCGHSFCNKCWTEYFIVKIDEGQSKRIRCMSHKCNSICDEVAVRKLVGERSPVLAEKFERFLLESYIEDNKMVKWCPSVPHCGNAIRVEDDELCEVECSCGLQFCFSCISEAHSPCSCLMWDFWSKKCQDESETKNWLMVHTKPCPKCHKPVEKNGGCNLVSCICGQAFCWLCGGATGREHTWSNISGHSCGRYREDEEKTTECAKRNLHRYAHYHSRYKAHGDSFKLEGKLTEAIKERISILEERDSSLRDFSWVTNGLHRLSRSRKILLYSYPFAFYMFGDDLFKGEMSGGEREIKQHLFEDQQQQLEANVENLSKLLEERFDNFPAVKVIDLRMKVINLSVIVDSLCKKMYECIENDLLGSLQLGTHNIASYKSKGIEKASEISACWSTESNEIDVYSSSRIDMNGGSSATTTSACSPRKRAKTNSITKRHFDLNLPPDGF